MDKWLYNQLAPMMGRTLSQRIACEAVRAGVKDVRRIAQDRAGVHVLGVTL